MNANQALKKCRALLESSGIDDPLFEAQCLVEKALGFDRISLIAHGDEEVENDRITELFRLTERRKEREPLQYILGCWSFCGFDFFVGEGVLIPRDDTEVVVNLCLDFLSKSKGKRVLDLCAGSGAISVALSRLAKVEVTAVELSDRAFEYLCKNINHNNAYVRAVQGDVFDCFQNFADGSFDLIVSNPPYIKSEEIITLQAEVQKEPKMALDGGANGYDFYKSIIKNWSRKLKGGALAFELGENQAEYVEKLMIENGFENIKTAYDLGGTKRAIIGNLACRNVTKSVIVE
jgi:release factor glutamine methyltransferase